jgi:hypothetical protein
LEETHEAMPPVRFAAPNAGGAPLTAADLFG